MKPTKTNRIILLSIFLICVIPTIYVYFLHAYLEGEANEKAKTETKKIKTLTEAIVFTSIGIGYSITAFLIIFFPQYRTPYYVVLVGTVIVILVYWFRMYGLQIPFTEIFITDFSADWMDAVTKICQQILVIPASIMLVIRKWY